MPNHTLIGPMIDGIRRIMRTRGYSPRTEESYRGWIERFLRFHDCPHWKTVAEVHAEAFLDHLANDAGLAASIRNHAASALAFLYREVLDTDAMEHMPRARGPKTVPVVFSETLRDLLKRQRGRVAHLHRRERRDGAGWVSLPSALCLGHESIQTTHIYLHADMRLKEQALARTTPRHTKPRRYRPNDQRERSPRSVIPASPRSHRNRRTPGMAGPSVPIGEDADQTKLQQHQPIPLDNE